MSNRHLAQLNIGFLLAPVDDPLITEFAAPFRDVQSANDGY